jgi:hypothetical protein
MPRLQVVFNCLNLFVADPENDVVHVLMPSTDAHGAGHRHEVQLVHRSFPGNAKKVSPMNGLALVLGKDPANGAGKAWTDLLPPQPSPHDEVLADLSTITGNRVARELVADAHHDKVAARVSLFGGRVLELVAETEFQIRGRSYVMAHQVVWEMLDVPFGLEWVRLDPAAREPLSSLLKVSTEPNLGYRLEINHTIPEPVQGPLHPLTPAQVGQHFGMIYPLLGIDAPGPDLLPTGVGRTDGAKCVGGKALIASLF